MRKNEHYQSKEATSLNSYGLVVGLIEWCYLDTFLQVWHQNKCENIPRNDPGMLRQASEWNVIVVRNSIDTIDIVSIPFGIVEYWYLI